MFRMWGKLWKDNHLLRDTVAANGDYSMSRTQMVFGALDFDSLLTQRWTFSCVKSFRFVFSISPNIDCRVLYPLIVDGDKMEDLLSM